VSEPLLRVEGLRVAFDHPLGKVQAVEDVSFALSPGERFGLAGESGSGKSTLALSILRLIKPPGRIEAGEVCAFGGPASHACRRLPGMSWSYQSWRARCRPC
jgi:ABC-type dipeptide/oligopeptide/nickel transport system ATPase component